MKHIWRIKPEGNPEIIENHIDELGIDEFIANMLVQRGIFNFKQAKSFFRPSLDELHDPFLMADMQTAVERLNQAVKNKENILVYGDYDVDGTTSVALVYSFLSEHYKNIFYYVPDRYKEGYGISFKGIDYAETNNCNLIIALDCGIKAIEKVQYAKNKNIDLIICDHHTPGNELPEACAVLDPKRNDCNYPFKELSGCGVGFKFLQAYVIDNKIPFENLLSFIDLVAVSIASDIVPINGENRILAYYGLKKLNDNPVAGLKAMIKIAKIEDRKLSISDSVFIIGPRINAAGRIKSGKDAVRLLISGDLEEAEEFSKQINDFNVIRKNLDKSITLEALQMIHDSKELQSKKSTIVYNPNWHKGVVGIVASRLIDSYYRPTIVLTKSGEKVTGSARSVEGFNLYNAIDSVSHLLEGFGGHMYAAGLNMKEENLNEFIKQFEKYVQENITEDQQIPKIDIDLVINFEAITPKFFRILKQFAPFGPENMTPVFATKNVVDTGASKIVGQTGEHLKLEVMDENGFIFNGIAFSMANHYQYISTGKPFDICYTIEENEFRGTVSLQLMIRDIYYNELNE